MLDYPGSLLNTLGVTALLSALELAAHHDHWLRLCPLALSPDLTLCFALVVPFHRDPAADGDGSRCFGLPLLRFTQAHSRPGINLIRRLLAPGAHGP